MDTNASGASAPSSVIIAPSLLSADWSDLRGAVGSARQGGADWLHLDAMDGHFVPNITFGPAFVEAVRRLADLPLDVHLMITPPEAFIEDFARAGADRLTVHWEATPHVHRVVQRIKQLGLKAGVAINPGTPWQVLEPLLPELDLVLIMTVNPGFGGQAMIESCLQKLPPLSEACRRLGLRPWLQVDGGIDATNAHRAVRAGANALVAGAAVYSAGDPVAAIRQLRSAALQPAHPL